MEWHIQSAIRKTFRVIVALGLVCATVSAIRAAINRAVCDTEEKLKVEISGIRFEVEYASCDVIAKDEAVSVYATKANGGRFLPNWINHRTLLFKYDPARWDNRPLVITLPSKLSILIPAPWVSSIFYQSYKWDDMSVGYDIGRVDYPAPSK